MKSKPTSNQSLRYEGSRSTTFSLRLPCILCPGAVLLVGSAQLPGTPLGAFHGTAGEVTEAHGSVEAIQVPLRLDAIPKATTGAATDEARSVA